MKKSLLLGILGLAAVAATNSYGQGGIIIGNYQAPFNKIVWGPGVATAGEGVRGSHGVDLTLWYGMGNLAADQLNLNIALTWKTDSEGLGYYGYYAPVQVNLPGWANGQTWTFQVRASGNSINGIIDTVNSRSALFFENANISSTAGDPPGLPGVSTQSIGLTVVVPEPSTFALVGLGAAALAIARRRS
jgi:hypothetical protein